MKKVISLSLALILTVGLLTACIQAAPVEDPAESKYLTWTTKEWAVASYEEKEKCAAAFLNYVAVLTEENNFVTAKIAELNAQKFVPEIDSLFYQLEDYNIETIKDLAEYFYEMTATRSADAQLERFLERSTAVDYLSWTKKDWDSANDEEKRYCATACLIYINQLGDSDTASDLEVQKGYLLFSNEMVSSLEEAFSGLDTNNTTTVKNLADLTYEAVQNE